MPSLKDYIIATRPWSLSMTFISVTVGTLVAWQEGPVAWGWYAFTLFGMFCFHSAVNILNDYFDTKYQVDQPDSPTVHYRSHPIFAGLMTPRQLLLEGILLFAATIAIGLTLAWARSPWILWIGLGGFLAGVFYTAGPVKYKYKALGEVSVALMWGPGMVEGAYAVQRNALSWRALWISIPFGVLVALVIFANNFRDTAYDARQKVVTLGILLGPKASMAVYVGFIAAAYAAIAAMVALKVLSLWGLLVLLSLPKAVSLIRTFLKSVPEAADALTAQLDTVFGVLLLAALALEKFFPL
jgi:1,4-dihydroxy-2-naphthoate octaprenyltransferase